MTYYNTTNQSSEALKASTEQAMNQDAIVLQLFSQVNKPLTPSQVHSLAFTPATPLTSVRRSISTLTKRGALIKTGKAVIGPYRKPEYLWSAL